MTETNLQKNPGFLMRRMQQVSVSIFLKQLRELDMTPLQYTVLRIIEAQPGIDQITVAAEAALDTSTVKDIVARLEAKGLVARETSKEDRRKRSVSLTETGAALLAEAQPKVRSAQQALLAPLPASEQEKLLDLLQRLLAAHEDAPSNSDATVPWRRFGSPSS